MGIPPTAQEISMTEITIMPSTTGEQSSAGIPTTRPMSFEGAG
jgi:hypothetical protein